MAPDSLAGLYGQENFGSKTPQKNPDPKTKQLYISFSNPSESSPVTQLILRTCHQLDYCGLGKSP